MPGLTRTAAAAARAFSSVSVTRGGYPRGPGLTRLCGTLAEGLQQVAETAGSAGVAPG
jgi:hypothetical protein